MLINLYLDSLPGYFHVPEYLKHSQLSGERQVPHADGHVVSITDLSLSPSGGPMIDYNRNLVTFTFHDR